MTTTDPNEATPTGRKRSQPGPDGGAATPTSAKKRKLNSTAKQPASAPRTLKAISSAISSVFGYSQQPQDPPNGGAAPAGAQSPVGSPSRRPAIKLAALKGTIWDNSPKPRLAPSANTTPNSAKSRANGTPSGSAAKQRAPQGASISDSPSKPRSVGRPRSTSSAQQPDDQDDESADELYDSKQAGTPSSAQKQLPVKRLWGSAAPSPMPKGILTPSKNRSQTPKCVKFDKQRNGELHFEDLPKSKKTTTTRKTKEKELVDEIVCGICSKAHSKPPNEIILCDNCDYAVHQECYGLKEIPEGDWLCKSCSQDDAFVNTPKKDRVSVSSAPAKAAADVPDIPNLDQHLRSLQRVLLDRCTGRRRIDIFGLQEVQEKAQQIVEQTVVAGEGNSMLLIGARGSGKTTVSISPEFTLHALTVWQLLENIISTVSREHQQDFHVVRLNGFIHTDDKLALKEIWRQLGKEMDVEDDLVNRVSMI